MSYLCPVGVNGVSHGLVALACQFNPSFSIL